MRSLRAVLALASLAGCSEPTGLPGRTTPFGVFVSAMRDDSQFAGVGYDIEIENTGAAAVFLQRCGDDVLLVVDVRENDQWVRQPDPDCAPSSTPGPMLLEEGASVESTTSFALVGQYRVGVRVSQSAAFTSPVPAMSAPIIVQ